MIYVTGDLHGNFTPLYQFAKEEGKKLTKNDYVIVLGDFGLWHETLSKIEELNQTLNYTLLFIEGNHEEFPLLESFPLEKKFGGFVHNIFGIYHLCRSEIFALPNEGKEIKIAVCGGGDSKDRNRRKDGIDWFAKESVTDADVLKVFENAKRCCWKVDYFLSHVMSSSVKAEWNYENLGSLMYQEYFEEITISEFRIRDIIGKIEAREYLNGHEHIDRVYELKDKRYRSVYKKFYRLQ